jgi:hypothetical protein
MHLRKSWVGVGVGVAGVMVVALSGPIVARAMAQGAPGTPRPEIFTATASIKTAGGVAATAPVTITVDWKMPQSQADGLIDAFKMGGADALRKALDGVAPTGSVRIGGGDLIAARMTIERVTGKGRLVTVVTLEPIVFIGAGVPNAKATDAYQFGVVDLEVDASGKGTGTLSPAAKITVHEGAFVVEDYASDLVELKEVSKVK